jgi:hypothetical protein
MELCLPRRGLYVEEKDIGLRFTFGLAAERTYNEG